MAGLLDSLLGEMTQESTVNSLAEKTGGSADQISSLISQALPALMQSMSGNASASDEGAASLLGALAQHTSTDSVADQIANADTEDGTKIIGHLLGGNSSGVISSLAGNTGLSSGIVGTILSMIAPALMSTVSNATSSAGETDGLDLGDMMGILGAATGSSGGNKPGGILGMLGNLFK